MQELLWRDAPAQVALAQDEVHVWRVWLSAPAAAAAALWSLLAADEQARARAFHFERHRQPFIVARGMLRRILSRYAGIPPENLAFVYGPQGKPALRGCAPGGGEGAEVQFNLSHSQELALLAVTRLPAVGVDVEWMRPLTRAHPRAGARPLDDMMGIAAHFFAEGERARLAEMPADQRHHAFFECWTRKEAYIKGIGEGLSRPLDQFEVAFGPDERARLLSVAADPEDVQRWSLHGFDPAPGYAAALAVPAKTWQWVTYTADVNEALCP